MKKCMTLALAAILTLGMGTTVFAAYANPNLAKLNINGRVENSNSYVIDGYTYFKLRDLGNLLGFTVGWDTATSSISITTPWGGNTVVQQPTNTPVEKEETEAKEKGREVQ